MLTRREQAVRDAGVGVGVVEHIHIAPSGGSPPRRLEQVRAINDVGLEGDRYAAGTGYWSPRRKVNRNLTLIESETLDELAHAHGIVLQPGEVRRNLTTRGVRLNDLVGETFRIGPVICEGTELCPPCQHLELITGKLLLRPLVHRGGLRARLVWGGIIRTGDQIERVIPHETVAILVERDNKILLARDLVGPGRESWATPGGATRAGETVEASALRNLIKQTGLPGINPRLVARTTNYVEDSGVLYRTSFVAVDASTGALQHPETDKLMRWEWHALSNTPGELSAPLASLLAAGYDLSGKRSASRVEVRSESINASVAHATAPELVTDDH